MSNQSQGKIRLSRKNADANRTDREPYAILWLGNREICLYEEDDASGTRNLPLN